MSEKISLDSSEATSQNTFYVSVLKMFPMTFKQEKY